MPKPLSKSKATAEAKVIAKELAGASPLWLLLWPLIRAIIEALLNRFDLVPKGEDA